VTHRIDTRNDGSRVVLEFQGILDRKALSEVRAHCAPLVLQNVHVRLVLLVGTEVEPGCLEELAGLQGVDLVAEAAFLRVWLERPRSKPDRGAST
jgi:hypothetical protein